MEVRITSNKKNLISRHTDGAHGVGHRYLSNDSRLTSFFFIANMNKKLGTLQRSTILRHLPRYSLSLMYHSFN